MANVMAIDQGTTGTTVLIVDPRLNVLGRATSEFPQIYPKPGWVEHDPEAIWTSTTETIRLALEDAAVEASSLSAIGITNQRETTLVWDRETSAPVYNAIVWQCRRTAARCEAIKVAGQEPLFRQRTGLVVDAYFSGTKVEWILDNTEGARARAKAGELAFGTIDSFLVWRLSNGATHVTDASNASRTLLFDIHNMRWDEELCAALNVPMSVLPRVVSCSEVYAHTTGVPGLPDGIPIAGMAGDQQAALFGQACFDMGQSKCTYGTGAFLLVNTGSEAKPSDHGMLTTVAWKLGDEVTYALEGSAFIAGAAVQWLRDGLGIIQSAEEVEALAAQVDDAGGAIFVPAFVGLGAPHWKQDARAALFGVTRGTTRAHVARAVLDGVALQIADILRAMADDMEAPITELRVDGGACKNNLLMQFQADIIGATIVRPEMIETTAFGAAFLAGLAVGVWDSLDAVSEAWREDRRFEPQMAPAEVAEHLERWASAIART